MQKHILITGTSSGIGKATVLEFASQGWQVIATQRNPGNETAFAHLSNVRLLPLDVTHAESVAETFRKIKEDYGALEAVVNNAGFGVDGVFESMDDALIRKQFETNVFGLMRMTREAIQLMRPQGGGTIIQISSMGGKITFPLYSIYHATKFAVEGFTESLHYELIPFGIRLKLVEPGLIATEFTGRSRVFVKPDYTQAYDGYLSAFSAAAEKALKNAVDPDIVARTIFKAATDQSSRLRYATGAPAPMILRLRKLLSDAAFFKLIRSSYKI